MLGFPQTTEFNKRIPKQKFYENLDVSPALKRVFVEQIKLIHWRNKLAESTLNIAPGQAVTEIAVIEIKLTQPQLDEAVLRQIDKEIPYHILFVLSYGNKVQAWTGYKEAAESGKKAFKVNKYYHTEWMLEDELILDIEGLNMDAVWDISYDQIEGEYDSTIFTAEKTSASIDKAFKASKHIQDYVFTDGYAEKSVERRFAEDLDAADEVCVYAKLPRGFHIPTPVGNYSPDWAIAFNEGTVKHIFFIAETKGTMESLSLKPIEKAKISCARKLFNEISTENVKYHDVDSYQHLLDVMKSL